VLSEKKFLNETKNHNPPFKLNGQSLSISVTLESLDTKYLGITIKDDLIWNLHINNIVSSANQVQGMLSRNIKKAPQQIKITAINTLVRPRRFQIRSSLMVIPKYLVS
jgi:hypothetical protein